MTIPVIDIIISPLILAPVFFIGWVILAWTLKAVLFRYLRFLASKTETQFDDILLSAANWPLAIMVLVWGVAAVTHIIPSLAETQWTRYVFTASKICTILAIILFVDGILSGLLQAYTAKITLLRISQGLTSILVHVLVFGLGGLVLLDTIGISITPLLASLGIGSLAVALALQPTLENVFSGFQILLDRPVVVGQFVKLESGEEGYVEKIGWRSTWVRQLANNVVVIPNKVLVNSRIINYYYPSMDLAVLIQMGVHYASDLEQVERIVVEVGQQVMKRVQGGVPEFTPFIRYHTFNSSSIDFTVILRGKEFVDNYLIKHEFIKAVSARFAKEGIVIPFPITAVNTSQESAVFSPSKS